MNYFVMKTFIVLMFSFVMANSTQAQWKQEYIDSLDTVFSSGIIANDSLEIGYRFYDSKSPEKRPLIVYLHGAGERGNDNKRTFKWAVRDIMIHSKALGEDPIILVPQCPSDRRWVEVNWSSTSHKQTVEPSIPLQLTMNLLDSIITTNPSVDKQRIYLMGMSMGGFGTWDWITRQPELFAAAIPICGGADEASLENVKTLPIWVFHGSNDNVVLPERSRRAVATLRLYNSPVQYTEYVGVDHNSWTPTYSNRAVFEWLFSKKKN